MKEGWGERGCGKGGARTISDRIRFQKEEGLGGKLGTNTQLNWALRCSHKCWGEGRREKQRGQAPSPTT